MQTVIKKILSDRKRFLSLLLLADEQETMVDKYIGRGDMFVMYTQDGVAICSALVTDEGGRYMRDKKSGSSSGISAERLWQRND